MKQSEGKLGIRELIAIILLSVGTKLTDDTPSTLFSTAKNSGWMSMLLIGIVSIIPVFFLIKVFSVHKDKNLHEVNIHLFGKVVGNLVSLGVLLFGFAALVLDSATYADIISTMYFTKTPFLPIYLILLIVCGYGAKRGIEHIGATAWLTFFYLKITLYLALLISFLQGEFKMIYPLWGPGIREIVKTAGRNLSIFADFYYLGLLAPLVSSYKSFKKGTLLAYLIVVIEIVIPLIIFVMVFDFTSIEIMKYPYHEMILYISIGFLTNVETVFLPFWLIATFIRFSFYFYLVILLFGGIFKIKEFEYLIPVMVVLVLFTGLAPKYGVYTIPHLREILLTILSPIFFGLPCLMLLIAKVKGDFKNEASKESY